MLRRIRRVNAKAGVASLVLVLMAVVTGSGANASEPRIPAVVPETYDMYSMMLARSAGQYFANGNVAGQWTWKPVNSTLTDISWGDPARWPPTSAERFVIKSGWVQLVGYSNGQGKPPTQLQKVTSEFIGDGNCSNMKPIPSLDGRQHYVKWRIPPSAYCVDARGTITSTVTGRVVRFRHQQAWGPPRACSNTFLAGRTCITQHERWWDDNGHPFSLRIERTVALAWGLGMAFTIRSTVPVTWAADGRHYWTW